MLSVVSGNDQSGYEGEELADPIIVRSNPQVPGLMIPVEITRGWGTVNDDSLIFDQSGTAEIIWTLGPGPENILKIQINNNEYTSNALYINAATEIKLDTNWTSGITYQIYSNPPVTHDNRILESKNFLVFSDASSDEVKYDLLRIAAESFAELKQDFDYSSSEELGIFEDNKNSKIKVFSDRNLYYGQFAFLKGIWIMGMDSQAYLSSPDSYKERYPNSVKHELVHVIQLIMGVGINGIPAPDAWFTEGLAEYMSGGSVTPIESPESLETWLNNPQTVNPITVKTADDLNGLSLSPSFLASNRAIFFSIRRPQSVSPRDWASPSSRLSSGPKFS